MDISSKYGSGRRRNYFGRCLLLRHLSPFPPLYSAPSACRTASGLFWYMMSGTEEPTCLNWSLVLRTTLRVDHDSNNVLLLLRIISAHQTQLHPGVYWRLEVVWWRWWKEAPDVDRKGSFQYEDLFPGGPHYLLRRHPPVICILIEDVHGIEVELENFEAVYFVSCKFLLQAVQKIIGRKRHCRPIALRRIESGLGSRGMQTVLFTGGIERLGGKR